MKLDPYEVLDLEKTASQDEIRDKYSSLIDEYTKTQDENTQEKINNLNLAYKKNIIII